MPKVKILMISTGYVESCSVSSFMVGHAEGFDTVKDALTDLANAFLRGYEEEFQKAPNPESDELSNYIREYIGGDNDSIGLAWEEVHEYWAVDLDVVRAMWEDPDLVNSMVVVHEYGASILAGMVGHGPPKAEGYDDSIAAAAQFHMAVAPGLKIE